MAVVTDSPTALFSRTPFIKPPDLEREWTAMPRSIVNFALTGSVISIKPINDQQELIISIDLPAEFCYRWLTSTVFVIQNNARDWSDRSYVEITNGVRGVALGNMQEWPMVNEFVDKIPSSSEAWIARGGSDTRLPTDILQAIRGVAPTITFKASNIGAPAGTAGTMNCLFTFLEFDIEQAQRFPIHWPTNILART